MFGVLLPLSEAEYEVTLAISLNSMRFLIFLWNISDVIGSKQEGLT